MAGDLQQRLASGGATTMGDGPGTAPPAGPPPEGVTVIRRADGTIVARKAVDDRDRLTLARELAVLRRLHELPVVQPATGSAPVVPADEGAPAWIDLAYVGTRTLASSGHDLTEPHLLRVLASAAATLAAAHERGISHGRIDGSHVLLGPDDSAVLCGWRLAGVATSPSPLPAAPATAPTDSAAPAPDVPGGAVALEAEGSAPFSPPTDVAALGTLAVELARGNPAVSARLRTQLGAVATAANHPDASVRPPMTELARVLAAAAGPAAPTRTGRSVRRNGRSVLDRLGARRSAEGPTGSAAARPAGVPAMRLVAAAVAAAMAAGLTVALWSTRTGSSGSAATGDRAAAPGATPQPAPATAAVGDAPSAVAEEPSGQDPCPMSAAQLAAAGLPERCAGSVTIEGQRLRVGPLSFVLGADGDGAGLSDLDCDGLLEATVLQTGSGRVYVYDRWADGSQPQSARLIGEVPGAINLGDPTGSACGGLRVTLADGSDITLSGEAG
ncbi:MAG: hypothetical protein AB7W59_33095 [Acidimicrobiia bacterium]